MPAEHSNRPRFSSSGAKALLWLAEALLTMPRYVRLVLSLFLAVAVTLATFPIMGFVAWLLTTVTADVNFYLAYVFTLDPVLLNVLLLISVSFGFLFYILGWRYYVGTIGDTPPPSRFVAVYFLLGCIAVLLASVWLVRGIMTLSAPV